MAHSLLLFKQRLSNEVEQLRTILLWELSQSDNSYEQTLSVKLKSTPTTKWVELLQNNVYPTLSEQVTRLNKVEAALCQFEQGVYGFCADCETQISVSKLNKDPTEQRCKSCANKSAI
ncbi:TraR/DksA family transcriptional regulator [Pseudoalteromonas denitrificans]|jgi:RNA polymerase-binding transcription factor DksA|uniref:Transcriptional regulator, TraR/DksA family n=1 Tax=Pseudoalteromonas denitrificans DSM 6059 TaxID=1123010 RepID=A0A1I1HZM7_9GAMM|nr:TraR/DksA C4-type zinc finger protein [Pseudoalteromonas denitrificans]SFC29404.1 transcriptional regulator, TraR/DksA family [Pseudoalteromonas denitrificans DSM 6059]